MKKPAIMAAAAVAFALFGCNTWPKEREACWHPPKAVNLYVSPEFPWDSVQRILIMPLANNSRYARVGEDMRRALELELQNASRFEVVLSPDELDGRISRDVMTKGKFDELGVLQICRQHNAQAVMFGIITDYSPYTVPRIGLSLIVVNPYEGVVIASLEHVWDSRELSVARDARDYHENTLDWPASLFSVERALESPDAFRRFVAFKVANTLTAKVEEATTNMAKANAPSAPSDPRQLSRPPQLTPTPNTTASTPYFPYVE